MFYAVYALVFFAVVGAAAFGAIGGFCGILLGLILYIILAGYALGDPEWLADLERHADDIERRR